MNQCLNCNSAITCGCQKRTASDGKEVCSNCLTVYEQKLVELKNVENTLPTNNIDGTEQV